jgi:hypothetical protein
MARSLFRVARTALTAVALTALPLTALPLTALPLAAQKAGQPVASPRDTVRGTIGGAHLLVDYGRPSKRGRQIFGGLVPFDVVWRTGANAATTFVTDKDLVIGTTPVPAGTYTLYTLPGASSWQLIINKQTKQWGTEYAKDQDLARIPMTVSPLPAPVEKMEIAIVPSGNTGTLDINWDTTKASVRIATH